MPSTPLREMNCVAGGLKSLRRRLDRISTMKTRPHRCCREVFWNTFWTESMEKQNGRIVESAVEARGGFIGRPVLVVLVVSSLLVIAILGGLYAYYFG